MQQKSFMDFKFHGLNVPPIWREVMPAFLALCKIVCTWQPATSLVLSDVLCGDVSHSAECFYYGLPPLLTSVGNKILVPGVVEGLWIWRPLLQRTSYSFPILLLVVPRGLCSSTCVKGSWFWNKYYYTTETGSSISTLPLESQGSASAFPEERPAAGLVVQPKCVIQSNYLIQFWWLDVKEVISDETLHFAVTWNKNKGGPRCFYQQQQSASVVTHHDATQGRQVPFWGTLLDQQDHGPSLRPRQVRQPILVSEIHRSNSPHI